MLTIDISFTVLLFVIFIGIIVWAWNPARKREFNNAAQIAIDDETDNTESNKIPEGHRHG